MQQHVEATHGDLVMGHRTIHRDREGANDILFNDYFSKNPTYNEDNFRRYWMDRPLSLQLVDAVNNHDHYFLQRRSTSDKLGLFTFQKLIVIFRILAYGVVTNDIDERIYCN